MIVPKIYTDCTEAASLPLIFDKEKLSFHSIETVDWAETYPYKPKVQFRIAHTDDKILIHYQVNEKNIRAKYVEDNDPVWTDSCVEFFSIPGDDDIYYNIECNCIGTILLAAGRERNNREQAPQSLLNLIKRWSSLGHEAFSEQKGDYSWQVALVIPYAAFFKHHIQSLDGTTIKANFYKCGDELETPHFLSWSPIKITKPDFHRPDFFGNLEFGK